MKNKIGEIACKDCGKTFTNLVASKHHCSFVHKVEENLTCNLCGLSCQNMKKLRKHTQKCLMRDPGDIEKMIQERPHIKN